MIEQVQSQTLDSSEQEQPLTPELNNPQGETLIILTALYIRRLLYITCCQNAITRVEGYAHQNRNGQDVTGGRINMSPARVFFGCNLCFGETHVTQGYPDLDDSIEWITHRIELTRGASRNVLICPESTRGKDPLTGHAENPVIPAAKVLEVVKQAKPWLRKYDFSFLETPY